MALEIKLNQKLSQSLVMTPQLQQAIKLLQLGRLEYLEVIEKELLENPVLEDAREEDGQDETASDRDDFDAGQYASKQESQAETDGKNELASDLAQAEQPLLNKDVDWSEYFDAAADYGSYNSRAASEDLNERPLVETTVSQQEGLSSHLLWQLRTSELTSDEEEVAAQIIGNLGRNGYLECSVEEIAMLCACAVEKVENVLQEIQSFDPAGIAARDLRECLLIQLNQLGLEGSLAWKIVDHHLSSIELRKYDVVAKAEGVPVEDVYQAMRTIQSLEPRPGRPFVEDSPVYITPDIYVRRVGNEFVISLNESGMPRLRVSPRYRELLLNGKIPTDAPNKDYLQDRLRSAAWLIKSVHQRQQTIFKVTESIFKFQRDFLEEGVSGLKPLVLREVADDVGMHESTVSRVTTNKYVHTSQGVFELKYFFSSGLQSGTGSVSSESVKDQIKQLISSENPRKPLSDQAIVDQLKAEGVNIARRTVAKYREMMGILSSSRRKKVF